MNSWWASELLKPEQHCLDLLGSDINKTKSRNIEMNSKSPKSAIDPEGTPLRAIE